MAVPNEKLLLSKNYILKAPAAKLLQRLVAEEELLTKLEHNDENPVPPGVDHLAKQLADKRIARHKDDSVRRVAGCCLMEIFRIYAPEPPLEEDEQGTSLECIVDCLRGLSQGPTSEKGSEQEDKYTRARIVLDQLVECQAAVAVADHAVDFERPDILVKMYRFILGGLHRRQQSAVVQAALECLSMALHRLEPPQVPPAVSEEVLEFACGRKGDERGRMKETALQVIRQNPQHLRAYVEAVMGKVLGRGDKPGAASGAGGPMEDEEDEEGPARVLYGQWEGLQAITRVVAQAAHPLLLYLVPRLGAELKNVDAGSRENACLTVSEVFCHSAPAGEQPFAAQFAREFGLLLACVTDRDEHVRVTAVPHVGEIAMQQPALCRRCCHALECALVDESNAVRSAAVSALGRVARHNPTMVPSSSVAAMADRLFDKLPAVGVNAADGLGRLYGDALAGLAAGVEEDGSGAVTSLLDVYGTGAAAEAVRASGGVPAFEAGGEEGGQQAGMAGDSDDDDDDDEEEEEETPPSRKQSRAKGKGKGKGKGSSMQASSGSSSGEAGSAQPPCLLAVPPLRDSDQALIGKLWWIPDALLRSYVDLSVQGKMRVVQIFDLVLVPAHAPEVEKAFRLLVLTAGLSAKGFSGLVAMMQARQRGQAAVREVVELVRKGQHSATFDEEEEAKAEGGEGAASGGGKGKSKGKKGKARAGAEDCPSWALISKQAQGALSRLLAACPHSSEQATLLAREGLAKVVLSPDKHVIRLLQAACSPMSVPVDALKAKKELTDRLKLADAGDAGGGGGSRARRAKAGGKGGDDQTSRFHALRPCLKTCQMLQLGVDVVPYMMRLLRCASDELGEGGGAHSAAVQLDAARLVASPSADPWAIQSRWMEDELQLATEARVGGFGPGVGAAGLSPATAQAEARMEQGGGSAAAEGLVGQAQASAAAAAASAGDGAAPARSERETALAAARSDASESVYQLGTRQLAEAYPWGGPHLAQAVNRGASLLRRMAKLFPQVLAACHEDLTDLCRTSYPPVALAATGVVQLCSQELREKHPIASKGLRQLLLDYAKGRDALVAADATRALLKLFPGKAGGKGGSKLDASLQRIVDSCKSALESTTLEELGSKVEGEAEDGSGDKSSPSPSKSRRKGNGKAKGTASPEPPARSTAMGVLAEPRDAAERFGVSLAVLGAIVQGAPAVWLSQGLDDLTASSVVQGILGAQRGGSSSSSSSAAAGGGGTAAGSRKRGRAAIAELGTSDTLLERPTACGSCSTQAACQAAAVEVAARRALGLFSRFQQQQREPSRPGESVSKEDTMEAGQTAVFSVCSAALKMVQRGAKGSSSGKGGVLADDRAAVLSACCRMMVELSTNATFLNWMHKGWGTLCSRVDPAVEQDERVRAAVVAPTVRFLRLGTAPLQAIGLLATAAGLGSGNVRSIGDSVLQSAVLNYRSFNAKRQSILQQQLDSLERAGEEAGSARLQAVQRNMVRVQQKFQPEISFPLLIHALCHTEEFPKETQLEAAASGGPDAVIKLLGPQVRALQVLIDALKAGSVTAVAFGFRAVGILEACDDLYSKHSPGRLPVMLAVSRLVLGSRVKTVEDSQPLAVRVPLPRIFEAKKKQAASGGRSPAIAASLAAVQVLGDADPKALPTSSGQRRGAPSTPVRRTSSKSRQSSGKRGAATPDTVDRFGDAAAGSSSARAAGGGGGSRSASASKARRGAGGSGQRKGGKRKSKAGEKARRLARAAAELGSSDEDEEEDEEAEEVLPSASRRSKGRGSRAGSSAAVESKSPEQADSDSDGAEIASPPRRTRGSRKGERAAARPAGDSTGKAAGGRRRKAVRG